MPQLRPAEPRPAPRALSRWLLALAALVFLMVVVGGITRLTESGLSITEWKPIRGIIPPLNTAQWRQEFAGYQAIPQYRAFNTGMTLAGFQHIYWWEYAHRLLGRLIGLALAIPLAAFWWRRMIPAGYGWRIVAIFALGGLQGAVGWWMVASGLEARTEVSHIRLAVHLLLALFIYSALLWTALDLRDLARESRARPAVLRALPAAALAVLAVQLLLGAFTAGLRAGYAFSSWPLMGESWFPAGGWHDGWGIAANAVDNPVVVQFLHRWWAWVAVAAVLLVARRARAAGATGAAHAIACAVALQILLGISVLMSGVALPLAAAHQAVAVLLLGGTVWAAHAIGRRTVPAPR